MLNKIVAGMLLASALPAMASAANYSFSYMGTTGITGSGTITTSDTPNSRTSSPKLGYDITAISGSFDGHTPLVLVPNPDPTGGPTEIPDFGTYDNILFPAPSTYAFDQYGIAFTAGAMTYNIFNALEDYMNNVGPDGQPVGPPPPKPYGLIAGIVGADDAPSLTYGDFTLTRIGPVPESSTWAMLIVGFGMMGGSIRYSRRRALAA